MKNKEKKQRESWLHPGSWRLNRKFSAVIILMVLLPILISGAFLFAGMEDDVVRKSQDEMRHQIGQDYEQIGNVLESMNISAQFFVTDKGLIRFLVGEKTGVERTLEELQEFAQDDITDLERLIYNNPKLYQIRVYVDSDRMQEIMPILYRFDRMRHLEWAKNEVTAGWKLNYRDTIFDNINQDKMLAALVVPIQDYTYGRLAVLEVASQMEELFPMLYEGNAEQYSILLGEDGTIYRGNPGEETAVPVLETLLQMQETEEWSQSPVMTVSEKGRRYTIGGICIQNIGCTLIEVNDITDEIWQVYRQRTAYIGFIILAMIGLSFVIMKIVNGLLRQFHVIMEGVREVQKGNLDVRIEAAGSDEMGELGNQINTMLVKIQELMDLTLKQEMLAKDTELRALQNQINAHFIYNVLEAIKMMAEIDEEYEISNAITTLGRQLRYGLKWTSPTVLVREELDYIRDYLKLMNLRYNYEINLAVKMPEKILELRIPKMSLQPIVENAICHGIEPLAEDTGIYIKGTIQGADCLIDITDSGRGMTEEEVELLYRKLEGTVDSSGESGNGIGLKNVQDRLKLLYGEEYGIAIYSQYGRYTKIEVKIPLGEGE